MKVLTILCQKGGVGKTTFVVNLGKLLSHKGHKTLLIDTDPQGNVSTYLNFDKNSKEALNTTCLLYTSPSPRDKRQSRMPSSA